MNSIFAELTPLQGFDSRTTTTAFQMVPHQGTRTVLFVPGQSIERLSWADSSIAQSKELSANTRVLFGKKPGTTFVTAFDKKGKELGKLEVCVKPKRTVKVAFNFVSDNAGHKTKRKHASVDGWVETVNSILLNQANVEIVKHSVRDVTVQKDLGKAVVAIDYVDTWEYSAVVKLLDATADVNIFFVWEWERDNNSKTDFDGLHHEGKIILEDNAGYQFGETIAHELCHYLGDGKLSDTDDAKKKRWLMYGITDDRGKFLPKEHILTINQN
jgi:hypothetical protein